MKDAVRDLRYQNQIRLDEEEQRMAKILRKKNKDGGAHMPEAVREMVLTVGNEETDGFQRQNDHLQEKGRKFMFFLVWNFLNIFFGL